MTNITITRPCPPHQWAHAPTVGYYLCGKCGERRDWNRPQYAETESEYRTPPNPSEPLVERVARALFRHRNLEGQWDELSDMSKDQGREEAAVALAALPAPADDVEWQARCRHLLACLDSCDEAQGLPSELDPDDAALIRETRAALAKVNGGTNV